MNTEKTEPFLVASRQQAARGKLEQAPALQIASTPLRHRDRKTEATACLRFSPLWITSTPSVRDSAVCASATGPPHPGQPGGCQRSVDSHNSSTSQRTPRPEDAPRSACMSFSLSTRSGRALLHVHAASSVQLFPVRLLQPRFRETVIHLGGLQLAHHLIETAFHELVRL